MANGRNSGKRGDSGRDSGGFIALPWSVMDSAAYTALSHPARSLLLEIARQFVATTTADCWHPPPTSRSVDGRART